MVALLTINAGGSGDRFGDWRARGVRLIDLIEQHAPDVVALQAIDPGMFALLGETLADWPHSERTPAGTALLARQSLTPAVHPLDRVADPDDANDRCLLTTTLGSLTIAVAHFSWVEALAVRNVEQTLAILGDADALIVGDFNQEPASPATSLLRDAGFTDSWARLRHGDAGFTFETCDPRARIDYIWARGTSARTQRIERVGGTSDAAISDHFGLLARVAE